MDGYWLMWAGMEKSSRESREIIEGISMLATSKIKGNYG